MWMVHEDLDITFYNKMCEPSKFIVYSTVLLSTFIFQNRDIIIH